MEVYISSQNVRYGASWFYFNPPPNEIMCLNLRTGVELCFGDFVKDIVSATVISAATGEEEQGE